MLAFAIVLAFFLGASIFSFYMACSSRVLYFFYGPARKQLNYWMRWKEFFMRRSFCDDCEMQLKGFTLLPVLGYFLSRRHCHHCGKEIPAIHPIMEFAGGALMVYFLLVSGDFALSLLAILFCGHMLIAVATDWTLYSLDYENTILASGIALLYLLRRSYITDSWPVQEVDILLQNMELLDFPGADPMGMLFQFLSISVWMGPVLTALALLAIMLPLHLWKPQGLGMGDVWLMIPLSLFHGMPLVLIPLIGASGWSILHILFIARNTRAPAPLGAFLALGSILACTVQFWFL